MLGISKDGVIEVNYEADICSHYLHGMHESA
jgi:hypothetical protein